MLANSEEKKLINQAQEGNHWAFEKLINQYDRQVLSMAYQFVGNTPDAEDIYQEVMLRIYQKIKYFRFESQFSTWLYRIVVNCALSYRKKKKQHSHVPMDSFENENKYWEQPSTDAKSKPDTMVLNHEIRDQITKILETLPMMQRVVFVLRFNEDFKLSEIADIVGCSVGTIKNHLFRCTQKMRYALSSYME
jgi:RNA polymerase sigma-70 factor (ECF subfamily)